MLERTSILVAAVVTLIAVVVNVRQVLLPVPESDAQIRELLSRFPSAKWHQWDPASRDNARNGAKLAFGEYVDPQYRFDQADVILSLDADFLGCGPGSLRYAKDFSARRRPEQAAAATPAHWRPATAAATASWPAPEVLPHRGGGECRPREAAARPPAC